MIVGSLLLFALFAFPMWNITLKAPQYPDSIGMDIWINKFADHNPNDIKNMNIMNHYVGMKDIPEHIPEFEIFPYVIGAMAVLGVVFGLIGNPKFYLFWFVVMIIFGSIGMYDFYIWEYEYGHNLKDTAAIKFMDSDGQPMAYQPPLIGSKMILNFEAISLPATGAYFLFVGMAMSVVAFVLGKKELENG